jgi:hypothetical protein
MDAGRAFRAAVFRTDGPDILSGITGRPVSDTLPFIPRAGSGHCEGQPGTKQAPQRMRGLFFCRKKGKRPPGAT